MAGRSPSRRKAAVREAHPRVPRGGLRRSCAQKTDSQQIFTEERGANAVPRNERKKEAAMTLISKEDFVGLFASAGLAVGDAEYRRFELYARLLAEKNAVMNLTAITEPAEVAEKHFLDSCLPLKLFDVPENASFVDVGAGAGFPSLPIAILRPDLRFTLIDSLNKRIDFLKDVCAELGINAECLHLRAEDAGRGDLRESFDIAAARAVSRLSTLCEYCLPLVKVGGAFLALKGGDCAAELREAYTAIKALGGKTEKVEDYSLPCGDRRTLIVIRKVAPTPKAYPRQQSKIKSKPL